MAGCDGGAPAAMSSTSGSAASGKRRRSPSTDSGGRIADRTRAKTAKGASGSAAADGDTCTQRPGRIASVQCTQPVGGNVVCVGRGLGRQWQAPPADSAGRLADNGRTRAKAAMRGSGCAAHECMQATSAWQGEGARDILKLLFNSGYVSQATAYNCMQVCNMWLQCVHHAPRLWRRIEFLGPKARAAFGDNWTQQILDGITAKRAKHLIFYGSSHVRRAQLSAILQCNGQLAMLELFHCRVDVVRALDSLRAPLHTLKLRTYGIRSLRDTAFADIVASAPVLTQLQVLDLSGSWVGDASVQLVAARFTQLRELVLASCPELTATAVSHLAADSAATRCTLRKLHVCGRIGIRGDIAGHILAMPNLERLDVGYSYSREWADNLQTEYTARYGRRIGTVVIAACEMVM